MGKRNKPFVPPRVRLLRFFSRSASRKLGGWAAGSLHLLLGLAVALLVGGLPRQALPQGVAVSSRKAQPARPLPPGMKPPQVNYKDLAREAGLTGRNISGAEQNKTWIVETTGTGLALIDYDNDELLDILLVNADRFDGSWPEPRHYLYRNLGNLRFEDVTKEAGLVHTGWAQGVCAGDVDNDGYVDLLITHWGQNVLFRNQGTGTFQDETKTRGLSVPARRWSTGCSFFDYDRDGDLDLFVANYVEFDPASTPRPGKNPNCKWKGFPVICGPRGLPPETMSLYQNDGRGSFTDVSEKSNVAGPKDFYGFTALSGDFDDDGWPDMYVACDSTASMLYRNRRDGTFEEIGVYSGAAYNEDGQMQAGMGAAAGDYDRDGHLDILKTNFSDDVPNLYRNLGDGTFSDVTVPAGLAIHTKFLGWGAAFLDFDQDGWKDIFLANGHVYPGVDQLPINEKFHQQRLLFWNRRDKQFYDISPQAGEGIQAKHSSRGVALGDLDNDGDLEIVIVNMHEPPSLLKNFGEKGNALLVRALHRSGRDAVGARLTLTSKGKKQVAEVRSGGYHISQGDFRVHFGLGTETKANLTIRWPQGKVETFRDLPANHLIVIQEGKGIVKRRSHGPEKARVSPSRLPSARRGPGPKGTANRH